MPFHPISLVHSPAPVPLLHAPPLPPCTAGPSSFPSSSECLSVDKGSNSTYWSLCRFGKPVAITSVGVHCLDRNGCYAPSNCSVPISPSPTAEGCSPSWWCCDWDSGSASLSGSMTQGSAAFLNLFYMKFALVIMCSCWPATLKLACLLLTEAPLLHPSRLAGLTYPCQRRGRVPHCPTDYQ